MFTCDYKKLCLAFNCFHEVKAGNMPEDGDYVLLELKDGRHTAGCWYGSEEEGTVSGYFNRGTFDSVDVKEVSTTICQDPCKRRISNG